MQQLTFLITGVIICWVLFGYIALEVISNELNVISYLIQKLIGA